MEKSCILRVSDVLWCIYIDNNRLFSRVYENYHWSSPKMIYDNAFGNIAPSLVDDTIYVFFTNMGGDIVLAKYAGEKWITSPKITQNTQDRIYNANFHLSIGASGLYLIYNMYTPENDHVIALRKCNSSGIWEEPSTIDSLSAFNEVPFFIQKVAENHFVMYYQRKSSVESGFDLGYRELNTDLEKWSDFTTLQTSALPCSEQGFLTTDKIICSLTILKTMYSYRLIFRRRDEHGLSKPVVIHESQSIYNCLIFMLDEQIWLTFESNRVLYTAVSTDHGASFTKPTRYRGNVYVADIIKTRYFSKSEGNRTDVFVSDFVYSLRHNPFEIELIPDLYSDFYPIKRKPIPKPIEQSKPMEQPQPETEPYSSHTLEAAKYSRTFESDLALDPFAKAKPFDLPVSSEHVREFHAQASDKYNELVRENKRLAKKISELTQAQEQTPQNKDSEKPSEDVPSD